MEKIEKAKKILKENNQIRILKFLDNLEDTQKEKIAEQILEIDFEQINKLYKNKDKETFEAGEIEPIKCIDKSKLGPNEKREIEVLGEKVLKENQYAVVTMAGGQGTRLGWKGPKGTFKLNVGDGGKYIFEILVDTLKKAKSKYGVEPYWYIMTSIENNAETIEFFKEHNYFGYDKQKIKFFTQGVLPVMDFEGNLLIDNNFEIKKASDGNGGVFKALKKSKITEDMKSHGIKWVYICGVDNIMANMVDSILLGLAIKNNMPSASKSIKRAYPEEKVGIFCKENGKPRVIEYTEANEEMLYSKDENDEFLYGESNFMAHLFNIDSLDKISDYDFPYHCAKKKNSYIDENLQEVTPVEPNSYKFEAFIFDGFEYLEDMIILRVKREEEFAPIKNATGLDSPESARKIYEDYKKKNF